MTAGIPIEKLNRKEIRAVLEQGNCKLCDISTLREKYIPLLSSSIMLESLEYFQKGEIIYVPL